MSEEFRIFPPKQFLRFLRWMIPVTALVTWLWKLTGSPHEDYIGGHYWLSWLAFMGFFTLGWLFVRLQRDMERDRLSRMKYCPTCGQPMPKTKIGQEE